MNWHSAIRHDESGAGIGKDEDIAPDGSKIEPEPALCASPSHAMEPSNAATRETAGLHTSAGTISPGMQTHEVAAPAPGDQSGQAGELADTLRRASAYLLTH